MRRSGCSLSGLVLLSLALVVIVIAVYAMINPEPVSRRLQALPYYVRTYANKVRPKPALPTPPAVSAVDAEIRQREAEERAKEKTEKATNKAIEENKRFVAEYFQAVKQYKAALQLAIKGSEKFDLLHGC